MKKSLSFIAATLAILLIITCVATAVLAEPESESSQTEGTDSTVDASASAPAEDSSAESTEESTPETSTEESAPEASDESEPNGEQSAPEVSDESEPETSGEESAPEESAPEESKPEESKPEESGYKIHFTLKGKGTVNVYKTSNNELLAEIKCDGESASYTVTASYAIKFMVETDNAVDVTWNEPQRAISGDYYYLVPSRDSDVTVTIKEGVPRPEESEPEESNPEESKPETSNPDNNSSIYTVRVNVSSGGLVVAGERTINGGNGTNLLINSGETIVFTVTPEENYELAYFKVDGTEVELIDNTYTITEISASATISVGFKTIGSVVEPTGIGVTDIDWSAENVVVDLTDGRKVNREVFDKIASLSPVSNKFVAFVSENATIYVPYGGSCSGTAESVDMGVSLLTEGEEYSKMLSAFGNDSSLFRAYSFNVSGNLLPVGTKVTFNLGGAFENSQASLYTFESGAFVEQSGAAAVGEGGVSGEYYYENQSMLVCASFVPGQFTIESILTNVGGNVNPIGINNVAGGSNVSYVITATEGYTIKQILDNDVPVQNVEGLTTYIYIVESVSENHVIKVEFAANEASDQPVTTEPDNTGTVIVVLVIIFVAVLGASALFIVKWRQEKF